jgi:hypothetical protein
MDHSNRVNFGHIVNGNLMPFSREFTNSGWRKTGPGPGIGDHDWYDKIDLNINSNGFRCDDFVEKGKHDGEHILFAGCSVTWGDALVQKDTWPSMVYDRISAHKKTSGFFNIGFPGMSIIQQIFWIMKYAKTFGNPDTIFFLMPNPGRFVSVGYIGGSGEEELGSSLMETDNERGDPGSLLLASYITFECYSMLEDFCKASGIRLISSTWSYGSESDALRDHRVIGKTSPLFEGKFDTFFNPLENGVDPNRFIYEYTNEHPEATIKALDNMHPGSAEHAYFATRMLDWYREITNEDIRF